MIRFIVKNIFSLLGWKIFNVPVIPKGLIVAAPHARTADFFVGLCVRESVGLDIKYLGKAELFRPPFGWIFYALGGTPLIRSENKNQVQQVVDKFNQQGNYLLAMAPEGTRKNVKKLRTGFYYMALAASVPIIMAGFDYHRKYIIFAEPFMPSGNFESDMQTFFVPFYKSIEGEKKDWLFNYEKGQFD